MASAAPDAAEDADEAAEEAAEEALLAAALAELAAEPVILAALTASLERLAEMLLTREAMEEEALASAVAYSLVKLAISLPAEEARLWTSEATEVATEPAADVMELKPLVADEKIDPAAPVPLLATALAPDVTSLTTLLIALPTTEVRELRS